MSLSELFSRLLEFLGTEAGPAAPLAQTQAPPPPNTPEPAQGKYAPLRAAIENRLEHLLRYDIPEHRDLAEDDVLALYYVEIDAEPEGQALLDEFCREFNQAARRQWVRKLLGADAPLKLDSLAGVFRRAELPQAAQPDPHWHILNQGTPATYRVSLWSQWVQAPQSGPRPVASVRGNAVVFHIEDSQGARPDSRRETYPVKIGRLGEIAVTGTYASAEHCTLHWRGGQVELEDHSKNGTWVDGVKLHRQRQPLGLGRHRLALGKSHGQPQDCPLIELDIFAETATPVAAPTPLDTQGRTPIADAAQTLLAVLSAQDASGNPHIDLLRLPFTIGRGAGRDYTTPPAHAGVSSLHLVIEALGEQGAEVLNEAHAKNGTALAGVLQGERFLWPFGEEITLAPKWTSAPPVRVSLKRPG